MHEIGGHGKGERRGAGGSEVGVGLGVGGERGGGCDMGGGGEGERTPKQLSYLLILFTQYQFPKTEASQVSLYHVSDILVLHITTQCHGHAAVS